MSPSTNQLSPDRRWRLLPSEQVLWQGSPLAGVPRDRRWVVTPVLLVALACIIALFAGLLVVAEIPAVRSTSLVACYLLVTALSVALLPRYLLDPCSYMVTDRQVIWRRGGQRRTIDCRAISFARIHWHRSVPGVGHLELVRAVPFGPLARKQRLLLHDVVAPDRILALIRGTEPTEFAGYGDIPITDRLDRGESVLWGAGPEGYLLGPPELLTAVMGLGVLAVGGAYSLRTGAIIVALESVGLPVLSATWAMLFGATLISVTLILGTGAFLLYSGLWGARKVGSSTEYLLTESRLLIRRGRTELSVDRRHIVDVAETDDLSGLHNMHLILDAPQARALDDSGALGVFQPPRAAVAPVLYEVRESELLKRVLLDEAA